jgi:hypothetical protein
LEFVGTARAMATRPKTEMIDAFIFAVDEMTGLERNALLECFQLWDQDSAAIWRDFLTSYRFSNLFIIIPSYGLTN